MRERYFKTKFDFLTYQLVDGKTGYRLEPELSTPRKDLMTRGRDFYAILDHDTGFWVTDEEEAIRLMDEEGHRIYKEVSKELDGRCSVLYFRNTSNRKIGQWHTFVQKDLRDKFKQLDSKVLFANDDISPNDHASYKLDYAPSDDPTPAWDECISTWYDESNRHKIEWSFGAIFCGKSSSLQKFMAIYGPPKSGKGSLFKLLIGMLGGEESPYIKPMDAAGLGSVNSSFPYESIASNPVVAVQTDGDLSDITDNTRLNTIVSHEIVSVNLKNRSMFPMKFQCFCVMASNKPVRITDAQSGLLRRLIDVYPTKNTLPAKRYDQLMRDIRFEYGGIVKHCMDVYSADPHYYDHYVPTNMLASTNEFYNFVMNDDAYNAFYENDGTTLQAAWNLYSKYCESIDEKREPYGKFREELKNYFDEFYDRYPLPSGVRVRSYYKGFLHNKFQAEHPVETKGASDSFLIFSEQPSKLDELLADCQAQYADDSGKKPRVTWSNCTTKLKDILTNELHFVRTQANHVFVDFDLKDENGNKSLELNIEAASKFPPTYAELSKSGNGIHLHYIYTGDVTKLKREFSEGIEIKLPIGKSSLRRKLTKCNGLDISTISAGLPVKKEVSSVVTDNDIKDAVHLQNRIIFAMANKSGGGHVTAISLIEKSLNEAYASGMTYDISPLANTVMAFAKESKNHRSECVAAVLRMKFRSKDIEESIRNQSELQHDHEDGYSCDPNSLQFGTNGGGILIYDVEVAPNHFLICYGEADDEEGDVEAMLDPSPEEVQAFLRNRLAGYNNRKYDNHVTVGRAMGYSIQRVYQQNLGIIAGNKDAFIGCAYNASHTDIFDFMSEKHSLKHWEIEYGLPHEEFPLEWDKPIPDDKLEDWIRYCKNDVYATRKLWHKRKADYIARCILADVAGGCPNDTTNQLTTKLIFGSNKHPILEYTDLSKEFPGYEWKKCEDGQYHNMYRGFDASRGGFVYSKPGVWRNVALLDVASLHPHSIAALNLFGEYTKNFVELMEARIDIKHKDFESAKKRMGGKLAKWLTDETMADALSKALKIAINSVYGLTSASFDNPFRDKRNVNNIVALRGALFMIELMCEVQAKGYNVVHIKTDSIKIADADSDIIEFCMDFAKRYKYEFEYEASYDRMCLVDKANYIARYSNDDSVNGSHAGQWTATGSIFGEPLIFKSLFSGEEVTFDDCGMTAEVKGAAIYLDDNEMLEDVEHLEKDISRFEGRKVRAKKKLSEGKCTEEEYDAIVRDADEQIDILREQCKSGHDYKFIGRIGRFTPIKPGFGGCMLMRKENGVERYSAVSGSKGYRWLESSEVKRLGIEDCLDEQWVNDILAAAKSKVEEFMPFEEFVA